MSRWLSSLAPILAHDTPQFAAVDVNLGDERCRRCRRLSYGGQDLQWTGDLSDGQRARQLELVLLGGAGGGDGVSKGGVTADIEEVGVRR